MEKELVREIAARAVVRYMVGTVIDTIVRTIKIVGDCEYDNPSIRKDLYEIESLIQRVSDSVRKEGG